MRIHVSESTRNLLLYNQDFELEERGEIPVKVIVRQRNQHFRGNLQMLSIVLFLVSNESSGYLNSESLQFHLGTLDNLSLFKMASKMTASTKIHPDLHYST
jgi:hypothetical protein